MERIKFNFGKRVVKSEQYPKKWKNIDLLDIDTKKPVILCFGGNGTKSGTVANGLAKTVENILGVQTKDDYIDIYSLKYSSMDEEDSVGELYFEECKQIADELILPLVSNDNETKIDFETAQKNMRNINIFTFCYGACIVGNIFAYVAERMTYDMGYSSDETSEILRQVLHVSYEPYGENSFTTNFEIKSFGDEMFGYYFQEEFKEINNITGKCPYIGVGQLNVKKNNINLFVSNLSGEGKEKKDHDLGWIAKDKSGKVIPRFLKKPEQLLAEFSEKEKIQLEQELDESLKNVYFHRANTIAECASFVLSLGVVNSKNKQFEPLPSVQEISNLCESFIDNQSVREQKEKIIFDKLQK